MSEKQSRNIWDILANVPVDETKKNDQSKPPADWERPDENSQRQPRTQTPAKMQRRNKKKTTITISKAADTGDKRDKLFPSLSAIRSKLVFGLQSKDKLPKVETRSLDENKSQQNGKCEYPSDDRKGAADIHAASPALTESIKREKSCKNVFEELYNLKNTSVFQPQSASNTTVSMLKTGKAAEPLETGGAHVTILSNPTAEKSLVRTPSARGNVTTDSANTRHIAAENNNCKKMISSLQQETDVHEQGIFDRLTGSTWKPSVTGKVRRNKRSQKKNLGNGTEGINGEELSVQTAVQHGHPLCSRLADLEQEVAPECQVWRKATSNSIVKHQTVSQNGKAVTCKKLTVNLSRTNLQQNIVANKSTVSVSSDTILNVPISRTSGRSSKASTSSNSVCVTKGNVVSKASCSSRASSHWEVNSVVTPVLQIATCARTDLPSGKLFDLRGDVEPIRVVRKGNSLTNSTNNIIQQESGEDRRNQLVPFSCVKPSITPDKAVLPVGNRTIAVNGESSEKSSIPCPSSQGSEQKQIIVRVQKAVQQQVSETERQPITANVNATEEQISISSTAAHHTFSPPNSPKRILTIHSPVKVGLSRGNLSQTGGSSNGDSTDLSKGSDISPKSPKYNPFVKRTPVQKATVKPMQMIIRSPESTPLDLTIPRLATIPTSPKQMYDKPGERIKIVEKPLDLSVPKQEYFSKISPGITCIKSASLPLCALTHTSSVSRGNYTCLVPVKAPEFEPSSFGVKGIEADSKGSSHEAPAVCSPVIVQREKLMDSVVAQPECTVDTDEFSSSSQCMVQNDLGHSNFDRLPCIHSTAEPHMPIDDSPIPVPDIKFAALKAAQVQEKLKSASLQGEMTTQLKTTDRTAFHNSERGESPPKLTAVTPPDKRNLSIVKPLTSPPNLSPHHSSPPVLVPVKSAKPCTTASSDVPLASKSLHQTPTELLRQYSAFLPTVNYKKLAAPLRILPNDDVLRVEDLRDICPNPKWDIASTKYYQANIAAKHTALQTKELRQNMSYLPVQDQQKRRSPNKPEFNSEVQYRVKVLKMPMKLAKSMRNTSDCASFANVTPAENRNEVNDNAATSALEQRLSVLDKHNDIHKHAMLHDGKQRKRYEKVEITPELIEYRRRVLRLPEKLVFRNTSRNLTPYMQPNCTEPLDCEITAVPNIRTTKLNGDKETLDADDPNGFGDMMCNDAINGNGKIQNGSKSARQRSPQKKITGHTVTVTNGGMQGASNRTEDTLGKTDTSFATGTSAYPKQNKLKETEDLSPDSKSKKGRKRRSLLDELSSSDGYIAEKRFRQNDTLLTDPSMLSREERALQRAMVQFSEMESRQIHFNDDNENNTSTKTLATTGQHQPPAEKKMPKEEIKADFNEASGASGRRHSSIYHKDSAYELALEIEADRLEHRRRQRRQKRTETSSEKLEKLLDMVSDESYEISFNEKYEIPDFEEDNEKNGTLSAREFSFYKGKKLQKQRCKGYSKDTRQRLQAIKDNWRQRKQDQVSQYDAGFQSEGAPAMSTPSPYGPGENAEFEVKIEVDDGYCEADLAIPAEVKRLMGAVQRDIGENVLHRAARLNYEDVAQYCCQTGFIDVNAKDNAGYSPLHECSVNGHINIARILILHGADVNIASQDGMRPLHEAVENDHIELVRLLLSCGADPNIVTYAGCTLQMIATSSKMKQFIKDFMEDLQCKVSTKEESAWQLKPVGTFYTDDDGMDIFRDIPMSNISEMDVEFHMSDRPHIPVYLLHREDEYTHYVLLEDALECLCLSVVELHNYYPELDTVDITWSRFIKQARLSQFHDVSRFKQLKVTPDRVQLIRYNDHLRDVLKIDVEAVPLNKKRRRRKSCIMLKMEDNMDQHISGTATGFQQRTESRSNLHSSWNGNICIPQVDSAWPTACSLKDDTPTVLGIRIKQEPPEESGEYGIQKQLSVEDIKIENVMSASLCGPGLENALSPH